MPFAEDIDDAKRALEFLNSFVAGSHKYFARTVLQGSIRQDVSQYTADCYGKVLSDGRVAILPHVLRMILEDKGGFKSASKLIAEFADRGYLETTLQGKPLGYIKLFGVSKRAYIFTPNAVEIEFFNDEKAG